MGLYDIPERAALNLLARSASGWVEYTITLSAKTAGTVYTGILPLAPILNNDKQFVGLLGDSGFTPDGSVFINEVSTADLVLNNGDYFIDYLTGYYKVKAGASGIPTISYFIRRAY